MWNQYLRLLLLMVYPCFTFSWGVESLNMQQDYHQIRTKEEFYSLYKENMYQKVDNLNANIFWLEHAKTAPFDHPVHALAKIGSEAQWKEYQKLFLFHINFLIMKCYILLAEQYDKPHILFFNPPYEKELKEGFQIAQIYYKRAQLALKDALSLADSAWNSRDDTPLSLDGQMDKWADLVYKMRNTNYYHEFNYSQELDKRLNNINTKLSQLKN